MFSVYCNRCFRQRNFEQNLQFHISRCGHVICKQCLQPTCPACTKPYNAIVIEKEMPPAMSEYFMNPVKHYRHYQKVMKFQHSQEHRLVEHLCSTVDDDFKKANDELKGYHKLQMTLKKKVEQERERVRKMKEYIAYHERRMEQVRYMTPPITAQPRLRYPPRNKSSSDPGPSASTSFNCMPQLTQTVRSRYPAPSSPTLSNNNSSGGEVTPSQSFGRNSRARTRTPPPLLPCTTEQPKKPKHHFSFSTF